MSFCKIEEERDRLQREHDNQRETITKLREHIKELEECRFAPSERELLELRTRVKELEEGNDLQCHSNLANKEMIGRLQGTIRELRARVRELEERVIKREKSIMRMEERTANHLARLAELEEARDERLDKVLLLRESKRVRDLEKALGEALKVLIEVKK